MINILSLQLPVILALQKISSPILNKCAEVITFFGESPLPFLICIFVFWCYDKKRGFALINSMIAATCTMQIIKAIFRVPRPYMAFPDEVKGMRVSTSTGYSFPSGHSTTTGSFYGALYKFFKPVWIKVICVLLMVLVPVSRLYLGAHWPLDVISGLTLGLLSAFIFTPFVLSFYADDKKFFLFTLIFAIITAILGFVAALILQSQINAETFSTTKRIFRDLMTNMAIADGIYFGFYLDRKYLKFKVSESALKRIGTFLLGLVSIVIIFIVFSLIPFGKYIVEFISYSFVGIYATYLFPLICTKIKWMEKE